MCSAPSYSAPAPPPQQESPPPAPAMPPMPEQADQLPPSVATSAGDDDKVRLKKRSSKRLALQQQSKGPDQLRIALNPEVAGGLPGNTVGVSGKKKSKSLNIPT